MRWFTFLPRLIAYGPKNNSSNGVDIDIVKLGGEEEEGGDGIAHWNEKLNNIFKEINSYGVLGKWTKKLHLNKFIFTLLYL